MVLIPCLSNIYPIFQLLFYKYTKNYTNYSFYTLLFILIIYSNIVSNIFHSIVSEKQNKFCFSLWLIDKMHKCISSLIFFSAGKKSFARVSNNYIDLQRRDMPNKELVFRKPYIRIIKRAFLL